MRYSWRLLLALVISFSIGIQHSEVSAAFLLPPNAERLRFDIELLHRAGAINVPISSWPLSRDDVGREIAGVDPASLSALELAAFRRVQSVLGMHDEARSIAYALRLAANPREIRTFENTPRTTYEAEIQASWSSDRASAVAQIAYSVNPDDGDNIRPDESWAGIKVGNWLATAGWQSRWWGPGHGGSVILSTNARPIPAIAIQRNVSHAASNPVFRWAGPWTVNFFAGQLGDHRVIEDPIIVGTRLTFQPTSRLEVGLSRTAIWCGKGRPCGGKELFNLLAGKDNRGVNVTIDEEPGNQLGGIDVRWRLGKKSPIALYLQWIAEDTRKGGPLLGSWLRLLGAEYWQSLEGQSVRSFVEIAETSCRRGGLGFSGINPNCGYEHSIYRSGYRYHGRSIGHGIDGDGFSYSVGSTLVQSSGSRWGMSVRYADINRVGAESTVHSLSPVPMKQIDALVQHSRETRIGSLDFGIGWRQREVSMSAERDDDLLTFVEWRSR